MDGRLGHSFWCQEINLRFDMCAFYERKYQALCLCVLLFPNFHTQPVDKLLFGRAFLSILNTLSIKEGRREWKKLKKQVMTTGTSRGFQSHLITWRGEFSPSNFHLLFIKLPIFQLKSILHRVSKKHVFQKRLRMELWWFPFEFPRHFPPVEDC